MFAIIYAVAIEIAIKIWENYGKKTKKLLV